MRFKDPELIETILEKANTLEEMEDGALRQAEEKKKARLRTRGPYRKTRIEI